MPNSAYHYVSEHGAPVTGPVLSAYTKSVSDQTQMGECFVKGADSVVFSSSVYAYCAITNLNVGS